MNKKIFTLLLALTVLFGGIANAQNFSPLNLKVKTNSAKQLKMSGDKYTGPITHKISATRNSAKGDFINETFATAIPATWTVTKDATSGFGWAWDNGAYSYAPYGKGNACANSDATSGIGTTYLTSPVVDCSAAASLFFNFNYQFQKYSTDPDLGTAEVWDGTTWQVLATYNTNQTPTSASFDITAYKNAALQVRFKYTDGGNWDWFFNVSDVVVYEPSTTDLGLNAIDAPVGYMILGAPAITPSVDVKNHGLSDISAYNVSVVITDAGATEVYNHNVDFTNTITAGSTYTASLTPDWTPAAAGIYTITAAVTVAGDGNTTNDTLVGTYTVYPPGILLEDFNAGTVPPANWTTTSGNTYHWTVGTSSFFFTMNGDYAQLGSDTTGTADMLVTPKLVLDGSINTLSYNLAGGNNIYGYGSSVVQLQYSPDGTTWTNVGASNDLATNEPMHNVSVDLSAIPNGEYYFGFNVVSSFNSAGYMSWVGIDDVVGPVISGTANNDLQVVAVHYPTDFQYDGATTTINVEVKNVGLNVQTGTAVTLTVDGTDVLSGNITSLAYGASEMVPIDWTAVAGRHTFVATVASDDNTANDTVTTQEVATKTGWLTEGFEGTFAPTGWTADATAYWIQWTQTWTAQYEGLAGAAAGNAAGFTTAVLATPMVVLTGAEELNFRSTLGNASVGPADLKVEYSADKATWTQIGATIIPTATMDLYTIDLSTIPAGNYYLGFDASATGNGSYSTWVVIDGVVGPELYVDAVKNIDNKAINVYPNPSNGTFNVNVNETYNLQVVDLTGKVISTQILTGNNTVSIKDAGVYFLKFSNEKNNFVSRVIVK